MEPCNVLIIFFPFYFFPQQIHEFRIPWVDRLWKSSVQCLLTIWVHDLFLIVCQRLSLTTASVSQFCSLSLVGGPLSTVLFGDKGSYMCQLLLLWIHQWKHLTTLIIFNTLKAEACPSFGGPVFPTAVSKAIDKDLFKQWQNFCMLAYYFV